MTGIFTQADIIHKIWNKSNIYWDGWWNSMIDSVTGVIVLSNLEKRFSREVLSKNTFFVRMYLIKVVAVYYTLLFPFIGKLETKHRTKLYSIKI